jgi:hypothetical protein
VQLLINMSYITQLLVRKLSHHAMIGPKSATSHLSAYHTVFCIPGVEPSFECSGQYTVFKLSLEFSTYRFTRTTFYHHASTTGKVKFHMCLTN